MKVVFAGPSLFGAGVDTSGINVRGPAQQGDVTRAVLDGATTIGLIDGAFSSVAAVWHKEILLALSRRVRVYGAASMGALRAAECQAFGMVPVGKIAHAYLSGEFDDDAAVALTMAPAEWGWQPLTEPLVDVLATLDNLRSLNELTSEQHASLLAAARELHFVDRTPEAIFAAASLGNDGKRLLSAYCGHHVSQKQLDAIQLIDLIRGCDLPSESATWHLESSPMWRAFRATDA